MITGALLDMLTAMLEALYLLLPPWSVDLNSIGGGTNIPDMASTGGSDNALVMILVYMQMYNSFVPFDHLVLILTTFVGFVAAVLGYKAIKFVIGVVRGAGTS